MKLKENELKSNIIHFKPGIPIDSILGIPRCESIKTECKCSRKTINIEKRIISCHDCKKIFDPYSILWELSEGADAYINRIVELKDLIIQRENELERLDNEIANKRYLLRRMYKKLLTFINFKRRKKCLNLI